MQNNNSLPGHEVETPEAMKCAAPEHCVWPDCMCEVEPHEYFPSIAHMGDCAVCGHVADSDLHKEEE